MSALPPTWAESTVGECFLDVRNGTTATQNTDGKGLPVSRIETVQKNQFDLSRIRHLEGLSAEAIETLRYRPGDIAFSHIKERGYKLDVTWLKDDSLEDADELPEPQDLAAEAITELEAVVDDLREIVALVEKEEGVEK